MGDWYHFIRGHWGSEIGTYNSNILPSTTGLDLGSPSQRWDVYGQLADFTGGMTVGNLHGIRFAGSTYSGLTTIQAAISDAGTTGSVIIPSDYAGVDSFTNPSDILILDFRNDSLTVYGRLISDEAAIWKKVTVAYSANQSFDAALGNVFTTTLTGNVSTATLSGLSEGQPICFIITQDGTGGRTFPWPGNVSGAPTINGTAGSSTTVIGFVDGSTLRVVGSTTSGGSGGIEVINVKDYGAVGDGVTDDTASILAAQAAGDYVYFPSGTYIFNAGTSGSALAIELPSNSHYFGDGIGRSVIKRKTPANSANLNSCPLIKNADTVNGNSRIYLHDLTIDGNSNSGATGVVTTGSDPYCNGLLLGGVTNIVVERCEFINHFDHCISGFSVNRATFRNNRFSNWHRGNYNAIKFYASNGTALLGGSNGIYIHDNYVDGVTSHSSGISLSAANDQTYHQASAIEICRNHILAGDMNTHASDGAMTSGSTAFASASSAFDSGLVNRGIIVQGAGTPGGAVNITGIQVTAGAGTLVTAAAHELAVGDVFLVAGTVSYNGNRVVTGVGSSTTATFSMAGTFGAEVVGTIKRVPHLYATISGVPDATHLTLSLACGNTVSAAPFTYGNMIQGGGNLTVGIELYGSTPGESANGFAYTGFVVSHNYITSENPAGLAWPNVNVEGISIISSATDGTISNNVITECHAYGIETGCANTTISDNVTRNCGQNTLDAASWPAQLGGNRWQGNQFGSIVTINQAGGYGIQVYAPTTTGPISDLAIINNFFHVPKRLDFVTGLSGGMTEGPCIFFNTVQSGGLNVSNRPKIVGNTFLGDSTYTTRNGAVSIFNANDPYIANNQVINIGNNSSSASPIALNAACSVSGHAVMFLYNTIIAGVGIALILSFTDANNVLVKLEVNNSNSDLRLSGTTSRNLDFLSADGTQTAILSFQKNADVAGTGSKLSVNLGAFNQMEFDKGRGMPKFNAGLWIPSAITPTDVSAGEISFGSATQTTVGAAGAASALPGAPEFYLKIKRGTVVYVIPVYISA